MSQPPLSEVSGSGMIYYSNIYVDESYGVSIYSLITTHMERLTYIKKLSQGIFSNVTNKIMAFSEGARWR